jgi:aspartate 1-decarboxylase
MQRIFLKSKLHFGRVTHSELEYEGSCAIDSDLLDRADIHPYEQLHIYNVTNGERFITYAISAESGSRVISVNGAAAHKARPGHRIIICTYAAVEAHEVSLHRPKIVLLDDDNSIRTIREHREAQVV